MKMANKLEQVKNTSGYWRNREENAKYAKDWVHKMESLYPVRIKEAIEDHRSSKKDHPRTKYGELISSADRNTRIEIVFIRSFFVAHERMPEMNIESLLRMS